MQYSSLLRLAPSSTSSRSSGSSTKSSSGDFVTLTGESGEVSREEVEPGHRPCPGFEKVDGTGEDALEAEEESREWAGQKWQGDSIAASS